MLRNFARINNYYNRLAAWEDWNKLAAQSPELAEKFKPTPGATWRKIDKCIAKLRAAQQEYADLLDKHAAIRNF